jgi:Fe-S cluster assembly protein SufD
VIETLNERSHLRGASEARLIFADNHLVHAEPLSAELKDKGVVLESLESALIHHGARIREFLFAEEAQLGSAKFQSLHQAFSASGGVILVPKGVVIEDPILLYHWITQPSAAVFPHTLVIAEEGSSVNVIDVFQSLDPELPGLCIAAANLYAGPNAQVLRKCVQNWSMQTMSFQSDATRLMKDASTRTLAVNLGSKKARFENQVRMAGEGSNAILYSLTVRTCSTPTPCWTKAAPFSPA